MSERWILHFDGGTVNGNPGTPRFGICIKDESTGEIIERSSGRKEGLPVEENTNNVAEFLGLIMGLETIHGANTPIDHLTVIGDSMLIIKQVTRQWKVKAPHLQKYFERVIYLLSIMNVGHVEFKHTLRAGNSEADSLSRLG